MNDLEESIDHHLHDLIIEFAEIAFNDPQICVWLKKQEKLGYDDAVLARDLQAQMNGKLYGFLREKKLPHTLLTQVKIAFVLVNMRMKGELTSFDSQEALDVIADEFEGYPGFYGVK